MLCALAPLGAAGAASWLNAPTQAGNRRATARAIRNATEKLVGFIIIVISEKSDS
jgi:hypothetical protein